MHGNLQSVPMPIYRGPFGSANCQHAHREGGCWQCKLSFHVSHKDGKNQTQTPLNASPDTLQRSIQQNQFPGGPCSYCSSSHFRVLSILLTDMIAKWCKISLLILRRSCVSVCPNKLKALSTWHAERGRRTKSRATDDKIGESAAFTSHQATLAEVVSGSGDGAGNAMYHSYSVGNLMDVFAHFNV